MATRRDDGPDGGVGTIDRTVPRNETKRPRRHKVILYNDDVSMPWNVVTVLMKVFGMDRERATDVMEQAHTKGKSICGIYQLDVAQTKVEEAATVSRVLGEAIRFDHEPD